MLAKFEHRSFDKSCRIWIEKYCGLRNIPHWHFESELIACFSGTAIVTLDGIFFELRPGFCMLCHSESIHCIAGSEDSVLLVAQFEKSIFPGSHECRLKAPLFQDHYQAGEQMQQIYREYQAKSPFYTEMVNALMVRLMVEILRGEELQEERIRASNSMLRYKELLFEIDQHFDSLTFQDAAMFMNMSAAYFSRFFKRIAGMTFSRYLNVVRVSKAIDLMAEDPDRSISELAAEAGFNTIRNFNRVFKEITGYSPKQLPGNFILHIRSLSTDIDSFDPTLSSSEPLSERNECPLAPFVQPEQAGPRL